MSRRRTLAGLLVAVVVLAGCRATADEDPVVVLAASSLTDVTAALIDAWGGAAVVSEAGSQVLAAQVRGGADADLLLIVDPAVAEALAREGAASSPVPLATTGLAVIVSHRAADRVTRPAHLAREGLTVVLADVGVPLGDHTRDALGRLEQTGTAPAGTGDAVLDNAVSLEDAARSVLAKVTTGEADAAVVYATDALAAGDTVTTVDWPAEADVTATYTGQQIAGARPEAAGLLRFLRSDEAAGIWRRFGFRPR